MQEILNIALSYPTVIFTILLIIVVLYWLTVVVGALDIDFLNFGSADGVDGALDGAADGALDGAADGALDGAMDGAADGALDGAAEGATESAIETTGVGSGGGLWERLQFGSVPVTVAFSVIVAWGWLISMLLSFWMSGWVGSTASFWVIGTGILGGTFSLSLILSSYCVRPLAPLFVVHSAPTRMARLHEEVKIVTTTVSTTSGQARCADGDQIQVRSHEENSGIKVGDTAVVIDYDEEREIFYVVRPESLFG